MFIDNDEYVHIYCGLYTFIYVILFLSILCVHLLLFVMYLEKKMDKTCMTKSRGTREHRDGCRSFVDFVVSNYRTPNGFIYYPLSRVEITSATRPVSYLTT